MFMLHFFFEKSSELDLLIFRWLPTGSFLCHQIISGSEKYLPSYKEEQIIAYSSILSFSRRDFSLEFVYKTVTRHIHKFLISARTDYNL